jgi:chemotaxis protein MotB
MSDAEGKTEILIIKRGRGGGEEGHHGGVWKIAYADFMTAMMAFFLVMWLVNAANEKTKTQVASYFNPVKLIDTRTNKKGLQSMDTGAGESWQRRDPSGAYQSDERPDETTGHDPQPRSDAQTKPPSEDTSMQVAPIPKTVTDLLDMRKSLASGHGGEKTAAEQAAKSDQAAVQRTPPMPEDLLALIVPETQLTEVQDRSKQADEQVVRDSTEAKPGDGQDQLSRLVDAEVQQSPKVADETPNEPTTKVTRQAVEPESKVPVSPPQQGKPDVQAGEKNKTEPGEKAKLDEGGNADEPVPDQIRQGIELLNQDQTAGGLSVSVEKVEGGYLISLTEGAASPMFAIATAEPSAPLRELTKKLGEQLQNMPGKIVVRGHTDGRNYDTGQADNWSLSSDRAHAAYRLLLQAGVPNDRFDRIEGYADTRLKKEEDPLDAANRRVEIFIDQMKQN